MQRKWINEEFDKLAAGWDNEPRRIERAAVIANEIIDAIPDLKGMNGFEYGCGTGLLSFNLRSYLEKIVLGDSSDGMLQVLRKKILQNNVHNMETLNIDLEKDEMPCEKYDVIYTLMTLHHITDIDKVLKEFSKALKPGGYLCIADLDEEDGSFHGEGFTGHNGFNMTELAGELKKWEFCKVKSKLCYEVEKVTNNGDERKYPVFLITAQKGL